MGIASYFGFLWGGHVVTVLSLFVHVWFFMVNIVVSFPEVLSWRLKLRNSLEKML